MGEPVTEFVIGWSILGGGHMLKIGICTKRRNFGLYVKDMFGSLLDGYEEWEIKLVSAEEVLEHKWSAYLDYEVFCLDEQLLSVQGIEPLSYISRLRPKTSILLLEGIEEESIGGIRYRLYVHELHQMQQRELKRELNRQWQNVNNAQRNLYIEVENTKVCVPIADILYIESSNRKVILHTIQGDYVYYEKLYALENLLREDGFIRCHQSYVVSKRYVTGYNSAAIEIDELSIPIGRLYKQAIYEAFAQDPDIPEGDENISTEKQGVLVGIKGAYKGMRIEFRPEQKLMIGRDEKVADIVVNLPSVSRLHCIIVYHEKDNTYEIVDVSKNGTYISGNQRLVSDVSYCIKAGTEICFGDKDAVYCLG